MNASSEGMRGWRLVLDYTPSPTLRAGSGYLPRNPASTGWSRHGSTGTPASSGSGMLPVAVSRLSLASSACHTASTDGQPSSWSLQR